MIVLDEPTNDLDAETLELLEERLVQFSGTVLVVSHDRAFLNNVVTSTYVFEDRQVKEYVGGYDDWQRQRAASVAATATPPRPSASAAAKGRQSPSADTQTATQKRRLSFKERQELQTLPHTIEQLESEIGRLHLSMAQEDFYRQPGKQISEQQAPQRAGDPPSYGLPALGTAGTICRLIRLG